MLRRTICFLVYPGCQGLDVCGPYEVFAGANKFLKARGKAEGYKLVVASARRHTLRTQSGLSLVADTHVRRVSGALDTLLVPGSVDITHVKRNPDLLRALCRLAKEAR